MRSKGFCGIAVPVIGQGTWHMGESPRQRQREIAGLELGLDLGLTHIDTAEMYGNGGAEEVVAAAIRGRNRGELFIASKVVPQNATYDGTLRAAEHSLRRLGTDYLDLYLLHWRDQHPLSETMRAMEDLVAAGKVRFIGVSNFDISDMQEAMAALQRERLACNQVLYNLSERGIEGELIPFCQKHDIAAVGYTPFDGFPKRGSSELRLLAEVGRKHGCSPRQVVLAFLTHADGLFAIPKATNLEHVRENAGAADVVLDADDLAAIGSAFPA
jgi:diketogulonate reductase-like aldo/keto reductase